MPQAIIAIDCSDYPCVQVSDPWRVVYGPNPLAY